MTDRPTFSDAQLAQVAKRRGLHALYASIARAIEILTLGTLHGALIVVSIADSNSTWYSRLGDAIAFGIGLVVLWLPIRLTKLVIAGRISRFDLRVQNSMRQRASIARSWLTALGMIALAVVMVIPSRIDVERSVTVLTSGMFALVGMIALGFSLRSKTQSDAPWIDWAKSKLCRRCGYHRGAAVHNCPECGEAPSNA